MRPLSIAAKSGAIALTEGLSKVLVFLNHSQWLLSCFA